jgi:hypothetical protein
MVYAAALAVSKKRLLIGWVAPPRLMLVLPLPGLSKIAVEPLPGTPLSQFPAVVQLLSGAASPVHVSPRLSVKAASPKTIAKANKRHRANGIMVISPSGQEAFVEL